MAFAEDFTPYFADFGVAGSLAGVPVRVIFDAPAQNAYGAAGGIYGLQPQVQIATASVPGNVEGQLLVLASGDYTVREHIPDGTGLSLLVLSRAA